MQRSVGIEIYRERKREKADADYEKSRQFTCRRGERWRCRERADEKEIVPVD
jgi:hypothetical protein